MHLSSDRISATSVHPYSAYEGKCFCSIDGGFHVPNMKVHFGICFFHEHVYFLCEPYVQRASLGSVRKWQSLLNDC